MEKRLLLCMKIQQIHRVPEIFSNLVEGITFHPSRCRASRPSSSRIPTALPPCSCCWLWRAHRHLDSTTSTSHAWTLSFSKEELRITNLLLPTLSSHPNQIVVNFRRNHSYHLWNSINGLPGLHQFIDHVAASIVELHKVVGAKIDFFKNFEIKRYVTMLGKCFAHL